jgi:L,D-transpeptidase catalytic domain
MGKFCMRARARVHVSAVVIVLTVAGWAAVGLAGVAHADEPSLVEGTPCTDEARACVDLAGRRAWLLDDGAAVRGPVVISPGGPGKETPRGDFTVGWKNVNHRSAEFGGRAMPFAVVFAAGGIAPSTTKAT